MDTSIWDSMHNCNSGCALWYTYRWCECVILSPLLQINKRKFQQQSSVLKLTTNIHGMHACLLSARIYIHGYACTVSACYMSYTVLLGIAPERFQNVSLLYIRILIII